MKAGHECRDGFRGEAANEETSLWFFDISSFHVLLGDGEELKYLTIGPHRKNLWAAFNVTATCSWKFPVEHINHLARVSRRRGRYRSHL
jgi:hypothetical protein